MIVMAVFDDCDYDFLDISLSDFDEIEKYQDEFFTWLFDKRNSHKYWVIVNGHKIGCDYGIEAFIDWMRLYHNVNVDKISPIIDINDAPKLYF